MKNHITARHLVSDDDNNGSMHANRGMTLPGKTDASHNIFLSPFFTTPAGYSNSLSHLLELLGNYSFLASSIPNINNSSYYFATSLQFFWVWPSDHNTRDRAQSLRCLVSTNNG